REGLEEDGDAADVPYRTRSASASHARCDDAQLSRATSNRGSDAQARVSQVGSRQVLQPVEQRGLRYGSHGFAHGGRATNEPGSELSTSTQEDPASMQAAQMTTSKLPDWDSLRIFLAVSRARTVAAAARRLGIDETTVARRLRRLEQQIGGLLVERSPHGIGLTKAGEAGGAAAGEMGQAAAAGGGPRVGADRQLSGRVRVTSPEILGTSFVLPALQAVHLRHPEVSIELVSTIVRLDVTRREADIAIRTIRPTESALITRKLGRMSVAP